VGSKRRKPKVRTEKNPQRRHSRHAKKGDPKKSGGKKIKGGECRSRTIDRGGKGKKGKEEKTWKKKSSWKKKTKKVPKGPVPRECKSHKTFCS